MDELLNILASTAGDQSQRQAVGRGFLLLVVLIIVGVLVVLGLLLAGFAWFAKNNIDQPERRDRFKGVDAWAESARRAEPEPDANADDGDGDWEAESDDSH